MNQARFNHFEISQPLILSSVQIFRGIDLFDIAIFTSFFIFGVKWTSFLRWNKILWHWFFKRMTNSLEATQKERFSFRALGPMFYLLVASAGGSIVLEVTEADPRISFVVAFICVICLAKMLGDATEVVSSRVGSGLGAVLNATFGNATELILGIFAIKKGLFPLMKVSIIGGVFGNLLLVGGLSLLLGGLVSIAGRNSRQLSVHLSAAQMGSTVLWTGAAILLIPSVVGVLHLEGFGDVPTVVAALACLATYGVFLGYSLVTDAESFEEIAASDGEDEGEGGYGWPTFVWVLFLGLIAAGVGLESDFFVGVIEPAAQSVGLREGFVAFVIVALAGGIAEHWSSISSAMSGKMALASGIVVGSSIQLMLFVLPVFSIYSMAIGQPADLAIDPIHGVPLLISFFLWDKVSQDGSFNWAEGGLLVIVALLTWSTMFFVG